MRSRVKLLAAAWLMAFVASAVPASAQTGRLGGTVKDDKGQPIKGATVVAENPSASPSSFTATTDDRGRWSIIGLRTGTWKVTASAPNFQPTSGNVPIRTVGTPNPPVDLTLAPGASGPAGALAGVNTKELQGELAKADAMLGQKQYDEAIAVYNQILAKTPALTMINMQIGNANRLKKDYDAAVEAYKKIPAGDSNEGRARAEIGMTYLEKGDMAAADAALTEAAQSTSATREVFYYLGEVKFNKGETAEAAKYYQRAIDVDGKWGKPYFKLGLARLQPDASGQPQTAEAIKMMEKVIEVDPSSPEATQAKALVDQLKK